MFSKILIANREEIACGAISSSWEMGKPCRIRPGAKYLAGAAALLMSGCAPPAKLATADIFTVELKMATPDGPVRVTNDMMAFDYKVDAGRERECSVGMVALPCGGTKLGGDAIAVPVSEGRTLVVLLTGPQNRSWASYAHALLDKGAASCARGPSPGCAVPTDNLPFMVLFSDPAEPRSAVEVPPERFGELIGPGYAFASLRVLPGGAAATSLACLLPRDAPAPIERLLPFVASLEPRKAVDAAQQRYALSEAVTDRNSYILGPLNCEEARDLQ